MQRDEIQTRILSFDYRDDLVWSLNGNNSRYIPMKEKQVRIPFIEQQVGLTEFQKKLFAVIRKYLNESTDGEKITNEEVLERIRNAFPKENDIQRVEK